MASLRYINRTVRRVGEDGEIIQDSYRVRPRIDARAPYATPKTGLSAPGLNPSSPAGIATNPEGGLTPRANWDAFFKKGGNAPLAPVVPPDAVGMAEAFDALPSTYDNFMFQRSPISQNSPARYGDSIESKYGTAKVGGVPSYAARLDRLGGTY